MVSRARADSRLSRAAGLRGASVPADFGALSRAARRGDAAAVALLERSARYVAVGVRTLANVMDLEAVVLTGPSFAIAGASYVPAIREELERAATAPAIGGAAMVLQPELVPLHDGLRLPGPSKSPSPR